MKNNIFSKIMFCLGLFGAGYNNLSAGLMGSRPEREASTRNFFIPGAMTDAQQHDLFTEMQRAFEANPLLALSIKSQNIDPSIIDMFAEATSKADTQRAEVVKKLAKEAFRLLQSVKGYTLARQVSSQFGGLMNAIHCYPNDGSLVHAIDMHISVFRSMKDHVGFLVDEGSRTHDKILSDAKNELKEALEVLEALRNIKPPISQEAVAKHLAVITNCWKKVNSLIIADTINFLSDYADAEKLAEAKQPDAKQVKSKL